MSKRTLNLANAYTLLEPGPVVLITTAHKAFPYGTILRSSRSVVDTRNALKGRRSGKIVRL